MARGVPRARRGGSAPGGSAGGPAAGGRRRRPGRAAPIPRWVRLLHRALSGAVTVDNMDYVRRDAYMCGVALGPVDVDRLIYYTFCTDDGLTFHKRALSALRAFLNARFYMYENVYFHRVGHAIDLHLHEIFRPTMELVLPRSPLDDLAAYRRLTEWSLFTIVESWLDEPLASQQARAGRGVAVHHPPAREVQHGVRAPHRAAAAAAGGARPHARGVPRPPSCGTCRRSCGELEFVVDIASQDPRPLNPLVGPKRIAVYDPATDAIEEQLLSGILEFVPAKAHLYRVFAVGRENERGARRRGPRGAGRGGPRARQPHEPVGAAARAPLPRRSEDRRTLYRGADVSAARSGACSSSRGFSAAPPCRWMRRAPADSRACGEWALTM